MKPDYACWIHKSRICDSTCDQEQEINFAWPKTVPSRRRCPLVRRPDKAGFTVQLCRDSTSLCISCLTCFYTFGMPSFISDLKETARSPEQLCVTTGKLYHSLCQWMVFTQIFVSYESVQYKRSAFTFLFNGSLYGKKLIISVTSAYIACATGKWYHSIELAEAFFWSIDIELLQRSQLALYGRSFEHPASLPLFLLFKFSVHVHCKNKLVVLTSEWLS